MQYKRAEEIKNDNNKKVVTIVATTSGKSGTALYFTGASTQYPDQGVLGTGSSTVSIGNTDLQAESHREDFADTDNSVQREILYTTDFNSITLSGAAGITELGIKASGTGAADTLFNREYFSSVTVDGTVEIQTQIKFEIF